MFDVTGVVFVDCLILPVLRLLLCLMLPVLCLLLCLMLPVLCLLLCLMLLFSPVIYVDVNDTVIVDVIPGDAK